MLARWQRQSTFESFFFFLYKFMSFSIVKDKAVCTLLPICLSKNNESVLATPRWNNSNKKSRDDRRVKPEASTNKVEGIACCELVSCDPTPIFAFKFFQKLVRCLVLPLALSWGPKAAFKSQLGVSPVKGNIEWQRANTAHLGNSLLQHEWRKEIRQSSGADSERPESF